MKIKVKANDESGTLDTLTIMKWGYKYYTTDQQIQELKDRTMKARERDAGNTSMFKPNKHPKMDVYFSGRMKIERLPEEIDKFYPRSPTRLTLKFVKYNTSGNKLYINYFSEVSK